MVKSSRIIVFIISLSFLLSSCRAYNQTTSKSPGFTKKISDIKDFKFSEPLNVPECKKHNAPEVIRKPWRKSALGSEKSEEFYPPNTKGNLIINVHLQTHVHSLKRFNTKESLDTVRVIQKNIYENVIYLAKRGAKGIISEGLPAATWKEPHRWVPKNYDKDKFTSGLYADVKLSLIEELYIWGFELESLHDFKSTKKLDKMYEINAKKLEKIENMKESEKLKILGSVRASQREMDFIFSLDDLNNVTRSMLALNMAIRKAVESENDKSQLIIGAGHLRDYQSICKQGFLSENIKLRFFSYEHSK